MTQVLILGGTGWLSGRVARAWADAGADVTCLARGGRPAPDGTELVIGDRAEPDAYVAVAHREWDEVVEISSIPEHVATTRWRFSPGERGIGRTSRRCRHTRTTRRSAPMRPPGSANPPARVTNTTILVRRPRPKHPSAPRSETERRSCDRGSSSDPATPPTVSATGSADSRSPPTRTSSCPGWRG